ncbi:MAG: hypothetical protein R2867_03950 [Caldilineaceae bacterium]
MATATNSSTHLPGGDALLVALLLFSLLMITGFAESGLGGRFADVARHPVLGKLLPAAGVAAMGEIGPRPAEPLGLLLHATALGLLGVYFLVDLGVRGIWQQRLKWTLLAGMILCAVYLPTVKLMLLDAQGPRGSYSHDGGVLQTEATIDFFLSGKNPYIEDYTQTPMATWGHPDFRTALYHYPYLPWTFVFSAPFYLIGQALGFYDQRLVYLLLLSVALMLLPHLVGEGRPRLALVALIGLNPLMGLDVLFGQNDVFVLCWVLFALVAWQRWRDFGGGPLEDSPLEAGPPEQSGVRYRYIAVLCFAAACASKPTAWFFAPFFGLLLLADVQTRLTGWRGMITALRLLLQRVWPALLLFGLLVLPYVLWDPFAIYDDVWRWSNGQGETGYQIWGWGASNYILAFGLVENRFAQWPFWRLELLGGGPHAFLVSVSPMAKQHLVQCLLALWRFSSALFL